VVPGPDPVCAWPSRTSRKEAGQSCRGAPFVPIDLTMAAHELVAERAPVAVFVDDSGQRRTRLRWVGRSLVVLLGLYVLLLAAGLTGSLSLPGVQLTDVGGLRSGAKKVALGTRSKEVRVPALFAGQGVLKAVVPPGTSSGTGRTNGVAGGVAPGSSVVPIRAGATTPAVSTPSASRGTVPPRRVPVTSTTVGSVAGPTTTVAPVTTTTMNTPPTTRAHGGGPPTSNPGQGHRP
jgi:hypothetical protein